jgi:hypothetical protein
MSHNGIEFNKDINSSNIKQYLNTRVSILCHTPEDWDYLMKITETKATDSNKYIKSSNKLFDLYDPSSVWTSTSFKNIINSTDRKVINIKDIYYNDLFRAIDDLLDLIEKNESKI